MQMMPTSYQVSVCFCMWVMEMKNSKAKAHILYLQVSIALFWGMRTDGNGQGGFSGLGRGLVPPTPEHCTGLWALHVCSSPSPYFLSSTLLGKAVLPSLPVSLSI